MGDKELNLNEMDQVAGGATNPAFCLHPSKTFTGEKKEKSGKFLFGYKCDICGRELWTEEPPRGALFVR